jgi:dTDP-4-dehydrorhamnose reductase
VTKVLQWARTQEVMRVVDDQISSPTSARLLAEVTAQLLGKVTEHSNEWLEARSGIYNCSGTGSCSRYDWATEIVARDPQKEEQIVRLIEHATSSEFPTPAERPAVSVLNCDKLFSVFSLRQPRWQVGINLILER